MGILRWGWMHCWDPGSYLVSCSRRPTGPNRRHPSQQGHRHFNSFNIYRVDSGTMLETHLVRIFKEGNLLSSSQDHFRCRLEIFWAELWASPGCVLIILSNYCIAYPTETQLKRQFNWSKDQLLYCYFNLNRSSTNRGIHFITVNIIFHQSWILNWHII